MMGTGPNGGPRNYAGCASTVCRPTRVGALDAEFGLGSLDSLRSGAFSSCMGPPWERGIWSFPKRGHPTLTQNSPRFSLCRLI